jgi:predicted RNA binding protein YcfA (HicA-like mRNA interferase family)
MPSIPGIGQRDAVRTFEKLGYRILRQGRHITMGNGTMMVQIPRHATINAFTMGRIAKTAGLTPDQFRALL